jgi:hypothetical protein
LGWLHGASSVFHELRDTGARPRLTISQTAGSVDKQGRHDQEAETAADRAEIIKRPGDRSRLVEGRDREVRVSQVAPNGGAAVRARDPLNVCLDASDKIVVELIIITDLAAADEPVCVRRRGERR